MFSDFKALAESMPCGVIITDKKMQIEFLNEFASNKILGFTKDASIQNLREITFLNTDLQKFNMESCMQSMAERNTRTFQKTLIVKSHQNDKLVFFSVKKLDQNGKKDHYIILLTDISNEMDCIVHTSGSFETDNFYLRKKIIGNDPKIIEIYRKISLAADSDVTVLIQGESGTGKELVADAIHELSNRRTQPFVKINCSAYSETLLESELFGHVKGSFTGAYKDKPGKFELAHGGTIFLDEIGEISPALQVKLLRVIQEKTIERVGDNKSIKVDMRIVAATNKDLQQMIDKNLFREDLYYRLNVFNIYMPALRHRHLDIPVLVDYFTDKMNSSTDRNVKGISKDAIRILMNYRWPGNIRELNNAIEYAFVLVKNNTIKPEDLPNDILNMVSEKGEKVDPKGGSKVLLYPDENNRFFRRQGSSRLNIEKDQLLELLEHHNFNQTHTAKHLGISRVALWKKMKKFELL
jgi:two-component system, NtrC family, response regulator HydG